MLAPREGWWPQALFSASQLKDADRCVPLWVLGYLYGRRSGVTRGTVLGTLIHECLESYLRGGSIYCVDYSPSAVEDVARLYDGDPEQASKSAMLLEVAPARAIAGIPLLPLLSECDVVRVEGHITHALTPADQPRVRQRGRLDLVTRNRATQIWRVTDHKSTRGKYFTRKEAVKAGVAPGYHPWWYVPSTEEMSKNVQVLMYALSLLLETGAPSVECQWVYYSTNLDYAPQATQRTVTLTLAHCRKHFAPWLVLATQLRKRVELAHQYGPPPLDSVGYPSADLLASDLSPCAQYGGCKQHISRGGPCTAGRDIADDIAAA